MSFSEANFGTEKKQVRADRKRVEKQVIEQLKTTSDDLKELEDLIVKPDGDSKNLLKGKIKKGNKIEETEITLDHSKAILNEALSRVGNKTGRKARNAIYNGNSAGVVFAIQHLLKDKKLYTGKIDGIAGGLTKKAVETFQGGNSLSVDGFAGKDTITALLGKSTSEASGKTVNKGAEKTVNKGAEKTVNKGAEKTVNKGAE
ncbi:MAG: hypothetical protein CR971_02325, partial [candidate division SR1 bacterium]